MANTSVEAQIAALDRAMVSYFAGDARRIDHARRVTAYARELGANEGADAFIVGAAGLLHDIGIHQAEVKHGSTAGRFQELEGPPIAREIMEALGATAEETEEVCGIVGNHHSPGKIKTVNFKCLYDADWLVNIRDEFNIEDRGKLTSLIDNVLLTESGKAKAREIYLK